MTLPETVSTSILSVLRLNGAYLVRKLFSVWLCCYQHCVTSCLERHFEIWSCGKTSGADALVYYVMQEADRAGMQLYR